MVEIAVDEEALEALSKMPEEIQESVSRVLEAIQKDKSATYFEPMTALPDDAPAKVKNEIFAGKGRAFHVGIKYENGNTLFIGWYEPYDRAWIVVYDLVYPAMVVPAD